MSTQIEKELAKRRQVQAQNAPKAPSAKQFYLLQFVAYALYILGGIAMGIGVIMALVEITIYFGSPFPSLIVGTLSGVFIMALGQVVEIVIAVGKHVNK